ncbi:hypothetical protein FA15DRAFT_707132 [Coprinopsis marcescibilis]|uniref:DUF6533 domain-containing protein n=1 Tax=Coprinopsis marcescibilis TaxID=230819 RepID=A0A5C3L005_COPMA|nr:hypothetical protein FA15DRAFT_707132 [Coprinopsis marcescibilis]
MAGPFKTLGLSGAVRSFELYQHVKAGFFLNHSRRCMRLNQGVYSVYESCKLRAVCEYMYMLEVEVEVIWKVEWSLGKAIYIFARLLPFLDVPLVIFYRLYPGVPSLPSRVCNLLYKVSTWSTLVGIFATEVILAMMLYALGQRNKTLKWSLILQATSLFASASVMWGLLLDTLRFEVARPTRKFATGCYLINGDYRLACFGFGILALNELILMSIGLALGVSRYKDSKSTLIRTLCRDGIFYYVFLFLVSLGEVIVLLLGPPEYADLLTVFQRVMHSILAARVMLNARSTVKNEDLLNSRRSRLTLSRSVVFENVTTLGFPRESKWLREGGYWEP